MTEIEIKQILESHKQWLADSPKGQRADLQDANLQGANLRNANLQGANLRDANLRDANLQFANLHGANLRNANLQDANLHGADLQFANLRRADLHGANLQGANLQDTFWDFSSGFPLSCCGTKFTCSISLVYLYLAHLCTLKVSEEDQTEFEKILKNIRSFAQKSHRAGELQLLEKTKKEKAQWLKQKNRNYCRVLFAVRNRRGRGNNADTLP